MALSVAYRNKYRLWADLVRGSADRLFVPTQADVALGASVVVQAGLPGSSMPVVVRGTVVARRKASLRFPAGVYVNFPQKELEKARRLMGLDSTPGRQVWGRKDPRYACSLRARLLTSSTVVDGLEVKNLSHSGLLLTCHTALSVGQPVTVTVWLDTEEEVALQAHVSWVGATEHLVGLRFDADLDENATVRVAACVSRLAAAVSKRDATRRVVIADDDEEILRLLATTLSRHGYECFRASDGQEAQGLIRELHPSLVLLDILMPGLDGVDICKHMRSDVELEDVPVIFVSALDAATLHTLADEAGATDFLPKPVAMADLLNLVGHYLRLTHHKPAVQLEGVA
ncbi:MAG: response regulator [Myxococcota bacterium]